MADGPADSDRRVADSRWTDGSGFCFDLPPANVVRSFLPASRGPYDLPSGLPQADINAGWSNWVDKWQLDWRFSALSDHNAESWAFPEVADPWMFTEYVFRGTGRRSDRPEDLQPPAAIISPPLFVPGPIARSFGDDGEVIDSEWVALNDRPATRIDGQSTPQYALENAWRSEVTGEDFWERDLDAIDWQEPLDGGQVNRRFTRLPLTRRYLERYDPSPNAGVRLYHQSVWSQSARWGESQNIPPRTITTTAPSEWFSPEGMWTGRVVPHINVLVGQPVYDVSPAAGGAGVVEAHDFQLGTWSVNQWIGQQPITIAGTPGAFEGWTYSEDAGEPALCSLPVLSGDASTRPVLVWRTGVNHLEKVVHRGCAHWKGEGGTFTCRRWADQQPWPAGTPQPHPSSLCTFYDGEADDPAAAYRDAGGGCPYYTPQGPRVLATYEAVASNGAEWANLDRGLPADHRKSPAETDFGRTMLSMAGYPMGYGAVHSLALSIANSQQLPDPYTDGVEKEQYTHVEVTYEPEVVSLGGRQVRNLEKDPRDPEGGERIVPGTGFRTLDTVENAAYPGVDSLFYGLVNQLNYRLMHSVQHCYRPDRCDRIISTPGGGGDSFQRGRFAGVDFTAHPWRPEGYPAADASENLCPYGSSRCPYVQLDRRAIEYDGNYRILLDEILTPFRQGGIAAFDSPGLQEVLLVGSVVIPLDGDAWAAHPTAPIAAAAPDIGPPSLLGHFQATADDSQGQTWRIYFFYDRPSFDPGHRQSRLLAHLIQFDDDGQVCSSEMPAEHETLAASLYGGNDQMPWLVELLDDYRSPTGNLIEATNRRAFAGGRHPQYRDLSLRGREVMSNLGGTVDTLGREGATYTNQFGGPPWHRAPVEGVSRSSYWVDSDGQAILDETPVPAAGEPEVSVAARIENRPPVVGGAIPIDGQPGMSFEDPAHPQSNRQASWARVGHTYSNDTPELIDSYWETVEDPTFGTITRWQQMLPADPNSDPLTPSKIPVSPPNPLREGLPVNRRQFQCSDCGLRFTQEEVNTLVDQGVEGCPRGDGGDLVDIGAMDRFLAAQARGELEVWAPPGSTVRPDGYFWRHPTLISRAHKDQIRWKLGPLNDSGGGYSIEHHGPDSDRWGRLPQTTEGDYSPGISRQLIAPWGSPGEGVLQIRQRVSRWFDLKSSDAARITRGGESVDVADESATEVSLGDLLSFHRTVGVQEVQIGLTVAIMGSPPDALMQEAIVQQDSPEPQSGDFADEIAYLTARREWLFGAVAGSTEAWASCVTMLPNTLAAVFAASGMDPTMADVMEVDGSRTPVDERLIAPYADSPASGLQMVSIDDLKRLRNGVLPILAYDLGAETYTAGGDMPRHQQLGNLQRHTLRRRGTPQRQYGTIPPQVMAATSSGQDYYVEWDVGDVSGSQARAYYPVGTTWWRMNQKVGQIVRHGGTNPLHLDDSSGESEIPYTGDVITSVCTFFLHGRIPMDKELVAAYVLFQTEDGPYAHALGCQGRYTGRVGSRNATTGEVNWDNATYLGHGDCFWQHFHPFATNHEENLGGFDNWVETGVGRSGSYWGIASKTHWETHESTIGRDDPTNPYPQDPSVVLQGEPESTPSYRRWLRGDPTLDYLDHVAILGQQFIDESMGFDFSQPFLSDPAWGEDLQQLMTEHEIWKDMDYANYADVRSRLGVRAKAAVDGNRHPLTFHYYAEPFRELIKPHEHQAVPGWLNFEGFDYSRVSRLTRVEPQRTDPDWSEGGVIIHQSPAASPPAGGSAVHPDMDSGGEGVYQAGNVWRVQDVTATLKRLYNDRVARHYLARCGLAYAELLDHVRSQTDTNAGLIEAFHDGRHDPLYPWNYRYSDPDGVWLSDPWHHPPTAAGKPIQPATDGDPISQTVADRQMRIITVSGWDGDSLPEDDPGRLDWHPYSLCQAQGGFEAADWAGGGEVKTPSPAEGGHWRCTHSSPAEQQFSVSLLQTPYETSRRPWRYQPPQSDSTGATCPNMNSCWIAQKGWTVGQVIEYSAATWGIGLKPSVRSSQCANCGTDLEGVVHFGGDGVTTVDYAEPFRPDALIGAIEVDPQTVANDLDHGFILEVRDHTARQWRPLLTVDHSIASGRYGWLEWDGTSWQRVEDVSLPSRFRGGGSRGGQMDSDDAGCHFQVTAGDQVRYRVVEPAAADHDTGWIACQADTAAKTVRIDVAPSALPVRWRDLSVQLRAGQITFDAAILSADVDETGVTIRLQGLSQDATQARLAWRDYTSQCGRFRVWGYAYAAGEITMTPPGVIETMILNDGVYRRRLESVPTQIRRVQAVVGTGRAIPMVEAEMAQGQPVDFQWQLQLDTSDGIDYLKVTGGSWYYDWSSGEMVVPATGVHPVSGQAVPIASLNDAAYAAGLAIDTRPSAVTAEYFSGAGVAIEVPIEAVGDGPSYQLEPECVCFHTGNATAEDQNDYPEAFDDAAPPPLMGQSAPLAALDGGRVDLQWQVYNHAPIIWEPQIGWLVGDELPAAGWDDGSVLGLFSGGRGSLISEASGGKLRGRATGTVTLYGPPCVILSGAMGVFARAVTERSYHVAGNDSPVTTRERTGGFRRGAFVWRLTIDENVGDGRKSIMAGVPRVLLYLRERKLTDNLEG